MEISNILHIPTTPQTNDQNKLLFVCYPTPPTNDYISQFKNIKSKENKDYEIPLQSKMILLFAMQFYVASGRIVLVKQSMSTM